MLYAKYRMRKILKKKVFAWANITFKSLKVVIRRFGNYSNHILNIKF